MPVSTRRRSQVGSKVAKSTPVSGSKPKSSQRVPKSGGKSKVRAVPDFNKLHKTWSDHMERGRAYTKKPCTVAQSFNLTKSGTKFQRAETNNLGADFKVDKTAVASIKNHQGLGRAHTTGRTTIAVDRVQPISFDTKRNLLSEIEEEADTPMTLTSDKFDDFSTLAKQQQVEGIDDFQEDAKALQSILDNTGIPFGSMHPPTTAPPASRQTTSSIFKTPGGSRTMAPQPHTEIRGSIYRSKAPKSRSQVYNDYMKHIVKRMTLDSEKPKKAKTPPPPPTMESIPRSIYKRRIQSRMSTLTKDSIPFGSPANTPKATRVQVFTSPRKTPSRCLKKTPKSSQKVVKWDEIYYRNSQKRTPSSSVKNKPLDESFDPVQDAEKLRELELLEKRLQADIESMEKGMGSAQRSSLGSSPKLVAKSGKGSGKRMPLSSMSQAQLQERSETIAIQLGITQAMTEQPAKPRMEWLKDSPGKTSYICEGSPLLKQVCEKNMQGHNSPIMREYEVRRVSIENLPVLSPSRRKHYLEESDKENTPPLKQMEALAKKQEGRIKVASPGGKNWREELARITPEKQSPKRIEFDPRTPDAVEAPAKPSPPRQKEPSPRVEIVKVVEKENTKVADHDIMHCSSRGQEVHVANETDTPRRSARLRMQSGERDLSMNNSASSRRQTRKTPRSARKLCVKFAQEENSPLPGNTPSSLSRIHEVSSLDQSLNSSFEEFDRLQEEAENLVEKPKYTRNIKKQLDTIRLKQEQLLKLQRELQEQLDASEEPLAKPLEEVSRVPHGVSRPNGYKDVPTTKVKTNATLLVGKSAASVPTREVLGAICATPPKNTNFVIPVMPTTPSSIEQINRMSSMHRAHLATTPLRDNLLDGSPHRPSPICSPHYSKTLAMRDAITPCPQSFRDVSPCQAGSLSLVANLTLSPSRSLRKNLAKCALATSAQKFYDALLDEEVALYASRLPMRCSPSPCKNRSSNPLAKLLEFGDDQHFIPIYDPAAWSAEPTPLEGSAFCPTRIY